MSRNGPPATQGLETATARHNDFSNFNWLSRSKMPALPWTEL